MAALEIELIRLAVFGKALGQPLFLFATQLHAQALGYLPGDFFLEREDVGDLPVVPLAPELRSLHHIHQLGADHQSIAPLHNPSREYDTHVQLAPDRLRVEILALVAEYRAARRDAKLGNLRQAVD